MLNIPLSQDRVRSTNEWSIVRLLLITRKPSGDCSLLELKTQSTTVIVLTVDTRKGTSEELDYILCFSINFTSNSQFNRT